MVVIGTDSTYAEKQWNIRYDGQDLGADAGVEALAKALCLTRTTARLLWLRGYRTPEEANRFFCMEDSLLHDPFLLRDIPQAVARIRRAVEQGERIAIYGDYDVDGVTSVSLLYLYFARLGADVGYFIPSRAKEGYGLARSAIDTLHEKGVRLIVTVDTGTTAIEEIDYASSLGIDVVVTDHHECRPELPAACAVVNPHRADDSYPFAELAGVGVAFKVVCAIEMERCREQGGSVYDAMLQLFEDYADLVAVGTVADVMPVTDENRLFVAKGLSCMEKHCRPGIRALIEAANSGKSKPSAINSSLIGFGLAPRINAAGRLSDASIAVELLLSEEANEASRYAERLCDLNIRRQEEETRIAEEAYAMIDALPPEERRYVLVIDRDGWHPGVIGIVASRVTERYGLPSILITYDGAEDSCNAAEDVGKGSGRSVRGLNLVEALASCEDLLVRYGGHELAAGLSVRRADVPALRRRLNEYAGAHTDAKSLIPTLTADCEVSMQELSVRLVEEIGRMEPFGEGNPAPAFVIRDVTVRRITPMSAGKHVRMTVERDGISMTAVWFGRSAASLPFEEGDPLDLLFRVNLNEFNGVCTLQMILSDARIARTDRDRLDQERERYEQVRSGASFSPEENLLPDREDIAAVYQLIRKGVGEGRSSFPVRRMLEALNESGKGSFPYGKLRIAIDVLAELALCTYTEISPEHLLLDFTRNPDRTDLANSAVLRRFRSQMIGQTEG